ncbi:MAG: FkbM family methyltransferase [Thiotrichales bacterium]|nr:FkbM family methyltransferase [Thiotrichales bacterium]
MNKLLKYKILRHLPGAIGHRHQCKYAVKTDGFEQAVRRCYGTTCIDLGANLGVYTRMMASHAKRVIAFEPDPWTLVELRNNITDLDNVRIENAAAGTSEGSVNLYRHPRFEEDPTSRSEASSVIVNKENVTEEGAIVVRQVDFIRYLENLDEDIGILKIDIEGAEVPLLEILFDRSDLMERISHIFAETHERSIPDHKPRVKTLRARARRLARPYVNLYWH